MPASIISPVTRALVRLGATVCFIGFFPLIPGTFASFCALLYIILLQGSSNGIALVTGIALLVGFLTAGRAEDIFRRKDPPVVVIDEVAGMGITLWGIPFSLPVAVAGFFLFRLFDTVKPYPVSRLQSLPGSVGIMFDDIVAGVYANLVLQAALRLAAAIGS